jgi:antitoxin component YwqK of YwqJK toxin-antitoxin module
MFRILILFLLAEATAFGGYSPFCPYSRESVDKQGRLHGKRSCFEDEAKKVNLGFETYEHGRLHGPVASFNPETKKKIYEASFRRGNLEGMERVWDRSNDQLASEKLYRSGKMHGPSKEYRDGKLMQTTRFENDVELGPRENFNLDSGLLESIEYLKANLPPYRTRIQFYETGDVKTLMFYKGNQSGELLTIHYFVNGKIDRVVCLAPGYMYDLKECLKAHPVSMAKVNSLVKNKGKKI